MKDLSWKKLVILQCNFLQQLIKKISKYKFITYDLK